MQTVIHFLNTDIGLGLYTIAVGALALLYGTMPWARD